MSFSNARVRARGARLVRTPGIASICVTGRSRPPRTSPPVRSRLRAPRPVSAAAARTYAATPAVCRVTATLKPTADSDIKVEVWLPKSGWNGKLQAVGNGGWAGTIPYTALAAAVTGGYAAAATDTGHSTPGASFAIGHPERVIDYAHRSLHEMAVAAKAVVNAGLGSGPKLSLWNGCSTGGNQGLTIASKYPEDFDAIVAGAPPDPRARLMSVRVLINRLVNRSSTSAHPSSQISGNPPRRAGRVRQARRRRRRCRGESARVPLRSQACSNARMATGRPV